jgi:hypothetical protein
VEYSSFAASRQGRRQDFRASNQQAFFGILLFGATGWKRLQNGRERRTDSLGSGKDAMSIRARQTSIRQDCARHKHYASATVPCIIKSN